MTQKLSLSFGILATMNVMFGTGILINTTNLIHLAGFYGFVPYILIAIFLIPLLYVFALLLKKYPEGGFYAFSSSQLGTFWGFLSTWAYFTGKLASATLLIHVFALFLLQALAPFYLNPLVIDFCVLLLFVWLHYYGMKTGKILTIAFIVFKLIPVLFIIISSLMLFGSWHQPSELIEISTLISALPLVLYAFVGFEAACSLSLTLKDPKKNAVRVLIASFVTTVLITIVYQIMAFLIVGNNLALDTSFLDIFRLTAQKLPLIHFLKKSLMSIIYLASGCAALGGAYGILLSNIWNLYILAINNHIPYQHLVTRKNKYGIPFSCVWPQAIICLYYFISTTAQQIALQQISVLAASIAFLISSISFFTMPAHRTKFLPRIFGLSAIASALFLMTNCLLTLWQNNIYFVFVFLLLTGCGVALYIIKKSNEFLR